MPIATYPGDRRNESTTRRGVVVFSEDVTPPSWVADWLRDQGREVRTYRARTHAPHGPPADLVQAVTELAGQHVLVLKPLARISKPARVVAAIGRLPSDDSVLTEAAAWAHHLGASLVVLHGVPLSFAERSVGLDDALDYGRRLLDQAVRQVAAQVPTLPVSSRLLRKRPHELVSQPVKGEAFVLGLPRHPSLYGDLDPIASSALHAGHDAILFVPTMW